MSYAQSHGVLVVAAAGNESSTALSYPAAYPGVIAVGATDAGGHRASFSNYGSWVTVGAPGVGIYSTVPPAGSLFWPAPTSGYASGDGTSFSSPIVAGEAALLAAAGPSNLTSTALRNAIVSSASGYAGLGLGAGQVDLAAALTKLPPASIPTLTAPAPAAIVGGAVDVTATSSATSVRFERDGVAIGAPVTVTGGTATVSWQTWGVTDGLHNLTASDCNLEGCGDASNPLSVTVQNATPSITSPADAAVVSNVVGLDVTTQNAPPKVRLLVDGVQVGTPVAVVANAAHLTWPSAGYANGTHTVGAAVCDGSGACGSSASVSVTLANATPVITSPKVGQVASGLFTVSATGPGGALVFMLGTKQVGADTTSPYGVPVNFSSVTDGSYSLTVKSCSLTLSRCSGPTASRSITVKSLHPSVTKAAPAVFSPNGDKRADTTTLTYYLPNTESVWWGVKTSSGAIVRGPYYLGMLSKGTRTFAWNGHLNNGARAADGTYAAYVSTKAVVGSSTLFGQATRAVRLDTIAPSLVASGMVSGFYPYTDGYRDTLAPKATVNEPGLLTMTVRSSTNAIVRVISVTHSGTGGYVLTWNGRNSSGHLVAAGTYKVIITAQDVALNRRSTSTHSVAVSLKKLVGTAIVKTVTPAATKTTIIQGSCSAVFASTTWSGAYDYESGYYYYRDGYCPDPADPYSDIIGSNHQLSLPAAVKYAGISVVATGQEELAGYGDQAYGWYRDTSGNLVGNGATLGTTYSNYTFGGAAASLLYGGRTLRWTVATDTGQYYTVRAFTVHYTYYVLK